MSTEVKRQIWTMGYFPFQMGGNVHVPIITKVPIIKEMEVGKGIKAFSFKTPKGTLKIAESTTGAIIGDSFNEVKKDVTAATKKVLTKQLKDAGDLLLKGTGKTLTNKSFFEMYKF